jgi:SAM-dependent methyltransferase
VQTLSGIFRCPVCETEFTSDQDGYACKRCQRVYASRDGIVDFFVSLGESDAIDAVNKMWLDPTIVAARNLFYGACARQLEGMRFCMGEIGRRTFGGCRILEVGMGTGQFTNWMAESSAPGSEIYAFDMSWPILETAKENTLGAPRVHLFRANARGRLPFVPSCFDIVLARLAPLGAHGVPNVQAAFELLKPGGWYFEAQWKREVYETPPTEFAMQHGFDHAEHHAWRYYLPVPKQAYQAMKLELGRMADLGGEKARRHLALQSEAESADLNEQQAVPKLTEENLLICRKPERLRHSVGCSHSQ